MIEEVYSTMKRQIEKYNQILGYYNENPKEIDGNRDRISTSMG